MATETDVSSDDTGGVGNRLDKLSEILVFATVLAALLAGFFHESLFGGKVLSPADVLLVEASFRGLEGADYEPANRLLMDPVLQFQPWLELNRTAVREGRLPLWNSQAGCGAPHLANGQSAVFDPFHILVYLGTVPEALAWMAAGRLWIAGLGMFLLARRWGLDAWGRWFAGLVFPFSGFLVAWLLYPVTPVAIWMPWLFLASERVLRQPSGGAVVSVAIVTAFLLFGGHVQTAAHALLAVGLFVIWRVRSIGLGSGVFAWSAGISLGLALAAVQIIPLADYLSKSPVWSDRQRELIPWWQPAKPRILDVVCSGLPYAFGSQRRGHPNLARALGVHNLNESSGGFSGLPTIALLVPLAWGASWSWRARRGESPRTSVGSEIAPFLFFLAVIGFFGAYRLPPVDNLLRLLPVLNVTDNRRLGLWMVFAFSLLGGIGIDRFRAGAVLGRRWVWMLLVCAGAMFVVAAAIFPMEPALRRRAEVHYREAADQTESADPDVYRRRAERRVRATIEFLPWYYATSGTELLILAGLFYAGRRRPRASRWQPGVVFALTIFDLGRFGMGLNPAIPSEIQSYEPPVIAALRRNLKPGQRALGVGEEFPPNVLMRFGLGDPRNYDSVELTRNLDWLSPLYGDDQRSDGGGARTSRRTIGWRDVVRARDRLEEAGVAAVVGASAPPEGIFKSVEKLGDIWLVRLDAKPWMTWKSGGGEIQPVLRRGQIEVRTNAKSDDALIVREMWDEGWQARVDGADVSVNPHQGAFIEIKIPKGSHVLLCRYDPAPVRMAITISLIAALTLLAILGLTRIVRY